MNGTAPIIIDPRLLEPAHAVADPDVPGASVFRRGKVRTVFEAGPDHFVIVASDRLSAYDSILPTPIPGKGAILSRISAFWMRALPERRAAPPGERRPARRSRRRFARTPTCSPGARSSCGAPSASTSSASCAATSRAAAGRSTRQRQRVRHRVARGA